MSYEGLKDALPSGWTIVPSKFWGRPVIQDDKGNLSCPGFSGNTYSKHPWESVGIAGVPLVGNSQGRTPGICEVTCDKAREVDVKKSKGSDGARITLSGLKPAKVEIRVHVWTPEQLKELDILRPIIFPAAQKQKSTSTVLGAITATTVAGSGTVSSVGQNGRDSEIFTAQRGYSTVSIPQVGSTKTTRVTRTTTKTVQVTQPFDVYHPVFHSQSVHSLLFIRCTGPTKSEKVPNAMVFTFEAMEWTLPKHGVNATMTPTSSRAALESTLESNNGPPGSNPGTADSPS